MGAILLLFCAHRVQSAADAPEGPRFLMRNPKSIGFPLTPLEFSVMSYLREHEDSAVGRESLLRDVWGFTWKSGACSCLELRLG